MSFNFLRMMLTAGMAVAFFTCLAQTVVVQPGIKLPADSSVAHQLISSLNSFLAQRENDNYTNTCILKNELLATTALIDEMKQAEHSIKLEQKNAYQPYLVNVITADDTHFTLQLAYMGISNNQPALRAVFELKALKQGNRIYFYSPLHSYTKLWHTRKLDNITFYFKQKLSKPDAWAYRRAVASYDKRLHAPHEPILVYYADDFTDVQHLLGIVYKADYSNQQYNNLTTRGHDTTLVINGWNDVSHRFDPHDLWHERLRTVMKPEVINRPVDEGCAYLYGGSWGYTWPEVLTKFKAYAAAHPNADWLQLYLDGTNFEAAPKTLKISYALNALLVQKIEQEKGFDAVKPLLSCGPKTPDDENYFRALHTVTGITKSSFNDTVQKLITRL